MANKPITAADFQKLWGSSVDAGYSRPFLENPDETGFEVWGQQFAQLERVSEAIDVTTQALFILPWSGQSNESARGGRRATVTLTLSRSKRVELPLVIGPMVFVEESTNDWGESGPVAVPTGRRYRLVRALVFNPGETGPFTVEAIAERPGYGYNNPLPNTLSVVQQLGARLSNTHAVYDAVTDKLTSDHRPDTPVPEHVGQYLRFTSGANVGAIKRAIAYEPALPGVDGGKLFFEKMVAVEGYLQLNILINFPGLTTGASGFIPGEEVQLYDVSVGPALLLATGTFVKQSGDPDYTPGYAMQFTFVLKTGVVPAPMVPHILLFGTVSKYGATLLSTLLNPVINPGPDEAWEMVGWDGGFGLTVTNDASPSGGRTAMLDALGEERKLPRTDGESDDAYAERVHQIADTISPNAIRRAGNRVLGPYGLSVCLREAGLEFLPGFYYDHDAYDYDFDVRPQLRNHVIFDYASMRGYFRIGVPNLGWGDFGFAYDKGPWNAYDTQGPDYTAFYDGYPWQAARVYKAVYQAIAAVIAGGVGFDLYIERFGCTP